MAQLSDLRGEVRAAHRGDEAGVLRALMEAFGPDEAARARIANLAQTWVDTLRADTAPTLMDAFLADFGLSTDEGVALMCLAEALLRVPDAPTIDALIEDKVAASNWGQHLGRSSSPLVNASTWALMLTGTVLDEGKGHGVVGVLRGALRRLGEPVIRAAVNRAMRELGRQFVLGQTMEEALKRAGQMERQGYTYSFDMLGEAAMTRADAHAFFQSYQDAIARLAGRATSEDVQRNHGISIKLSALHPRYDALKKDQVMRELVPVAGALVRAAKDAGIGLNIDAEEADRLDLSLDVIEALLADPDLAGWDGFGVVVQAYGKRAGAVIDWLYGLAHTHDRRVMVRLVKGAYWDTEIKRAQVDGVRDFPVFTTKAATDVAFLCCARKLLGMGDRIYPQFATHNAHTMAGVLDMAGRGQAFEFQRLHGMGEALHSIVMREAGTRCRIYAPVGTHRDLLAYLVRRLLENGANSSFVNQIMDTSVPSGVVAADPFAALAGDAPGGSGGSVIARPCAIFGPDRVNSAGWDLRDPVDWAAFEGARTEHAASQWRAGILVAGAREDAGVGGSGNAPADDRPTRAVVNPADPEDIVGHVVDATAGDVDLALSCAEPWRAPADERARTLEKVADMFEAHHGEIFAILAREAGKSPWDAVSELREAVDFLRYYANEARRLQAGAARGVVTCISPWNFPLAIFTGQIAAALATGNGVVAKPAEPTAIMAWFATRAFHDAGVPRTALQLLPGPGRVVGAGLTKDPRVAGVWFTGSMATAQTIHRAMADHLAPSAPLIAETGGLNAMVVDSTALPEQAVRDVLASAFQSAGQRCSALRVLYVQEDVRAPFLQMLFGAMDELVVGAPWDPAVDVGPVITTQAQRDIEAYLDVARGEGRVLKQIEAPSRGHFAPPSVIAVSGIEQLDREIFGPVLHVASFPAHGLNDVLSAINAAGYGLTFGLHSRIDDRVEAASRALRVGNLYINRNQIGAVVGSQPFGGEGLSGTGPKAGGPHYAPRFQRQDERAWPMEGVNTGPKADVTAVQRMIDALPDCAPGPLDVRDLPGPTGESNRLSTAPRGVILCLGPRAVDADEQARQAQDLGCQAVRVAPGVSGRHCVDGWLDRDGLRVLRGIDGVALWGQVDDLRAARRALAARDGALIALITEADIAPRCVVERHVCIDTTAAGGNVRLMAQAG